jgi:hypothetical protein
MPKILSAIDAVSPAFEQTKQQLLKPFRFSFWSRMAVVALTTGEFSSSGGAWSGNSFTIPSVHGGRHGWPLTPALPEIWRHWHSYLPYLLIGAVFLAAFMVVWMYVSSVFRFILFDSVLTGHCDIKQGWRRWQAGGASYFLWKLCFSVVMIAIIVAAVLTPILLAAQAGIFRNAREHILLLVLGGAGLALLTVLLIVAGALVALFAKDFVIPVMALDDVRVLEGWRRFLPMLGEQKKSFAGYVLMKIVLAVGCAIIFGILTIAALLLLLVPLGIGGFAIYMIARAYSIGWNFYTMIGVMAAATALVFLLFYVVSFISTPAMIFFQSYINHFLGSRYPRLGARVFVEPPPPAPAGPAPEPSPAG